MPVKKYKAIIVDDHEMFRNGLKSLLEQENIAEIVAEASNGLEFLQILKSISPDIVLMDINMPVMNGIEAIEKAYEMNKNLNILVLSMYDDYSNYSQLVSIGVKGFITKSSGKLDLEKGIKAVINGQCYFSSDLLRNVVIEINKSMENSVSDENQFTNRELEVLQLICNGYTAGEIAEKLFLSSRTIDNYRSNLLQKTGVKNSVGLVLYAIKNKIISF